MKKFLIVLTMMVLTHNSFAEQVHIPDPVSIDSVTNAMFDLKTDVGGQFRFYFVTTALHDKCLAYLEKAETVYGELKSAGKISEDQKQPYISLRGSEYTFVTGDYTGETVFKVDSCVVHNKRLRHILPLFKGSIAKMLARKIKKNQAEESATETDVATETESSTNSGNKFGIGKLGTIKLGSGTNLRKSAGFIISK